MKRFVTLLLLLIMPVLAMADSSSLTFAPPPGDYSVIFLGNLFGVVDGVLHGTGSQIVGAMFSVFNSAVLALGGIIIMYTLMVSTMNTAHEGQMLGQKWSSIWIPVRSTLGLALLIPKASGYCLMQVFVMWIVVQGIGAADKIWEAALGYLNRGGVIIQAQTDPTKALLNSQKPPEELIGARAMLTGQVCMLGLQKQLEVQRQAYLDQANKSKTGGCNKPELKPLCQTAVPDFIGSVNAVTFQNKNKDAPNFEMPMPNFDTSPYSDLNGICGKITWNNVVDTSNITVGQTSTEKETTKMSRAIAVGQMYLDLAKVATIMVNNSPQIGPQRAAKPETDTSAWAIQQYGVPINKSSTICAKYNEICTGWGPAALSNTNAPGVLFNGTELQGAFMDYRGIMMPVLRLMQQASTSSQDNKSREFITDANSKGWIMAGSYFFDLVKLNGNAVTNADLADENTGLKDSDSKPNETLLSPFKNDGGCSGTKLALCHWFGEDPTKLKQVLSLINGGAAPIPEVKPNPDRSVVNSVQSSTVNGFINNSLMVQIPGQPGLKPLEFPKFMSITVDTKPLTLQWMDFSCGGVTIIFFKFCLGWMFGNLFYNIIFLTLYNAMIAVFAQLINQVVMAVLMIPLQGMSVIFKQGMATLAAPGVNPIVALANMGTMYINFAGNLWIMLLTMAVTPFVGIIIFPIIMLAMPLIIAWVGIMVAVGFTTAYYIPIMPYMIFTFASIGWIICVIEAMVAAPLVALGVTHPEGHDAFGKGEQAIMILMNVFLRPAMMIIGYIMAIALSYVGVWILNAGFDHAISFIQGGPDQSGIGKPFDPLDVSTYTGIAEGASGDVGEKTKQAYEQGGSSIPNKALSAIAGFFGPGQEQGSGSGETKFTEWAGIYAFFFSILTYTMMYLIIVQKAFTLITHLPDKVLRWIGGQAESAGQEAAGWSDEVKKKGEGIEEKVSGAQQQVDKKLGAYAQKGIASMQGGEGSIEATKTK